MAKGNKLVKNWGGLVKGMSRNVENIAMGVQFRPRPRKRKAKMPDVPLGGTFVSDIITRNGKIKKVTYKKVKPYGFGSWKIIKNQKK